jgi:hypothetical protein
VWASMILALASSGSTLDWEPSVGRGFPSSEPMLELSLVTGSLL